MTDMFTVEIHKNFVDPGALQLDTDIVKVWPKFLFQCI